MRSNGSINHLDKIATIDYKNELVRKGIHLLSLSIPTIYFFITQKTALLILVPLTLIFVLVDTTRYYVPFISKWFYKYFGWLLRKRELDDRKKRLNGASNVLISATLCILLFPKIIAINAFAILIVSDTTSALFGRKFGRRKFFAKSLEGSIAFFISAILVVLVAPKYEFLPIEYIIGIIAAAIGAIVEALPINIDDNLSIPISVSLTLMFLYYFLAPSINLFNN